MGTVDNRITEFTKSLGFFSGLPEADMKAFLDAAVVRDYKKGDAIFHQGDAAQYLFVMLSGWVKLTRSTVEGEEALLSLFTRGDVFAEAALFHGANYSLSAHAAEQARVLTVPAAVLKARAAKNPDIMNRMLASQSREIQNLQRQAEQALFMRAPQRVACLLLQLSSHMIGTGGTFTFPFDKALAAARLGMTPETFSRALVQLKPYGVVTQGPEISIDSFQKLNEYSCGHCTATPADCKGCRAACPLKGISEKKRVGTY
jgi:CRP/FNR family transcriptional regulator, dissimilatory nitrate respiration regulator